MEPESTSLKQWLFTGPVEGDPSTWIPDVGACVVRVPSPDRAPHDEDSAAVLASHDGALWLVVADGAGGHVSGERASKLVVEHIAEHVRGGGTAQSAVDAVSEAHERVRSELPGAATTLTVCTVVERALRVSHVGDSGVVVTGQRGKVKLRSIAHSPTGYAVEAGVLEPSDALSHEDRHFVSNLLGMPDMHVEVWPSTELAAYDTVVLGSDGLFDNVHETEVVEAVRKGALVDAAARLRAVAERRMAVHVDGSPSKPDDLTFILYRPGPS
jgi:serine/threonine protein phosphatase PrpC